MKDCFLKIGILMILVFNSFSCGTQGQRWVEFQPDKGGCSVLMPGIPNKVKVNDVEMWSYKDAAGHIFSFGYSDMPGSPDDPDQLLNSFIKNGLPGDKIFNSRRLTYKGFPAIEFEQSNGRGDDLWVWCCFVHNRLYQLSVDGITTNPTVEPNNPPFDHKKTAHRYFDSFKLTAAQ